MLTRRPLCLGCHHYQGALTCAAFPDGIPTTILESVADHRQPYDGDHGILFTPLTPDDAAYADVLFPKETPDVQVS